MIELPPHPSVIAELVSQCAAGLDIVDQVARDCPERCERASQILCEFKETVVRECWRYGLRDPIQIVDEMAESVEEVCLLSPDGCPWEDTPLGHMVLQ